LASDQPLTAPQKQATTRGTGRCYCGLTTLTVQNPPLTVAYCHCTDCRRITGAPVAAFATYSPGDLDITPDPGSVTATPGVNRWFCRKCGSPLAVRFDYLPGQVYVPIGLLDQADELVPEMHCHTDASLPWLHIDDDLERHSASGRAALRGARRPSGTPQ